jgi:mono/diheme cytochrome c family protein
MKTVLKAGFVVLAFSLMFSTFSMADNGADTFKAKCAMCHGADGAGKAAMGTTDLGAAATQGKSDADLAGIITSGKGKMPKYDGKLTKDQIDEVVKYIRTLKK